MSHCQSTFTHWLTLSLTLTLSVHFYQLADIEPESDTREIVLSPNWLWATVARKPFELGFSNLTHHLNSPSRLSLQNFVPIRVGQIFLRMCCSNSGIDGFCRSVTRLPGRHQTSGQRLWESPSQLFHMSRGCFWAKILSSPLLPTGWHWAWHCQSTFTHWLTFCQSLTLEKYTKPESDIVSPLLPTSWHWAWVWHCQSTFTHWLTLSLSLTMSVHFYPLADTEPESDTRENCVAVTLESTDFVDP